MVDVVDNATRSRMMAGIRAKNTKPEMVVRRYLHAHGLRYQLHVSKLPGKPDLVFQKYRAVLFVHGCFWHVHSCEYFKWPKTRVEFWEQKLTGNIQRDKQNIEALNKAGWRVFVIWECEIREATSDVQHKKLQALLDAIKDPNARQFVLDSGEQ